MSRVVINAGPAVISVYKAPGDPAIQKTIHPDETDKLLKGYMSQFTIERRYAWDSVYGSKIASTTMGIVNDSGALSWDAHPDFPRTAPLPLNVELRRQNHVWAIHGPVIIKKFVNEYGADMSDQEVAAAIAALNCGEWPS